jgi:hypothetical protein
MESFAEKLNKRTSLVFEDGEVTCSKCGYRQTVSHIIGETAKDKMPCPNCFDFNKKEKHIFLK